MQVSVEKTSSLERRLTIVVPSGEFEDKISSRLMETRGRVQLRGFRPGKVPMKEVRRRFGAAARAETASELMRESCAEAVQREDLTPAGMPRLEVVQADPGADFEFTATFEVFPTVELADFSQFEIDQPACEITSADIDDMVQRLREQRKQWDGVERAAAEGDMVAVDFEGRLDGEPFAGGTGENVSFEVGSGRMLDEFDQAVCGMTAGGEKTFLATFPDDHHSDELAGKTVEFTVSLQSVKASRLPEVDEDFIKAFGVEDGDMEAFRTEVTENMRRELDETIRAQVKRRVMDQLAENHEVESPKALVQEEVHALKDRVLGRLPEENRKTVSLPDDLFQEQAERQVALRLVLREIVREHELAADAERVRERIEALAEPYADKEQVVGWYYGNREQLAGVEMSVLEDRVVETVLASAQVNPRRLPYADIIAGQGSGEDDLDERERTEQESEEP